MWVVLDCQPSGLDCPISLFSNNRTGPHNSKKMQPFIHCHHRLSRDGECTEAEAYTKRTASKAGNMDINIISCCCCCCFWWSRSNTIKNYLHAYPHVESFSAASIQTRPVFISWLKPISLSPLFVFGQTLLPFFQFLFFKLNWSIMLLRQTSFAILIHSYFDS